MRKNRLVSVFMAAFIICALLSGCVSEKDNAVLLATETEQLSAENKSAIDIEDEQCRNEFSLTRVRMTGRGENTNGYKVAFMECDNMEGVTAFLVGFSSKSTMEVRDYLAKLTYEEIQALDKPENRAYIIKDLSYADGVGNTLNTDQHDIVTGNDFTEPGTYYFYACTLGESGLLGIERAKQTVTVAPYANSLEVNIDNNIISGSYKSYDSDEVINNMIFYSSEGYVLMKKKLASLSYDKLGKIAKDNRAILFDRDNEEYEFTTELNDFDGEKYDENKVYYIYVASIGKDGITGLSYNCVNMLTPDANKVVKLDSIGEGEGNGWVFPNGGASSINGTRDSIIGVSQMMFKSIEGKPRIAVIGASSGSEKEIYSYFYVDETSVKSYENRFNEAGFEAVYIPLTMENYAFVGDNPYYAALVESCHGVYFTGGNQSLCARALYNDSGELNAIGKAVINTYQKGGIIMGTSAGAHVVSDPCFQDGESYGVLMNNGAESFDIMQYSGGTEPAAKAPGNSIYYKSLDIAKDAVTASAIFDSHFSARGRFGRLALIARDTKARFAIGLDESTGLAVSNGQGIVFGSGTVTIIDTKLAQYGNESNFSVKNLIVHCLSAGDKFDFTTQTLIPSKNKSKASVIIEQYIPQSIFDGNYETVKAFMSFVLSGEESEAFFAKPIDGFEGNDFKVSVKRNESLQAYTASDCYASIGALAQYPISAYTNLCVDIEYCE